MTTRGRPVADALPGRVPAGDVVMMTDPPTPGAVGPTPPPASRDMTGALAPCPPAHRCNPEFARACPPGRPGAVTPRVRTVLVPGLGLDGRSSARLRRLLPTDVVLLPGMGLAAAVPDVDGLADRLRGVLGPGPVLLVGHSQSCQVVVAAARRDTRVTALALLGPTTEPLLRRARGGAL